MNNQASVLNPTFEGTTTLDTGLSGVLKATAGVVSEATADTDFASVSWVNEFVTYLSDGLLVSSDLAISGTAEKFKTTSIAAYTIGSLNYTKAATDNLTFTAADTINTGAATGDFWGIWLVQINAAGTVSTKSPSSDQVYASSALALAALPEADADNTSLGYILIEANTDSSWTANTDDMTPASDCQASSFVDASVKTVPSAK